MRILHRGDQPRVHPTAYVAPTAVLSGDVLIGPSTCVLHGAILNADGGSIKVGDSCVIMENAVLRGTRHHPLVVGGRTLIGPHSYLTGCSVGEEVFVATSAKVFNGAILEDQVEVRINGVVHVNTRVARKAVIPIGWIAVGDPAQVFPPEQHERIWRIQEQLDFPRTVFGLDRAEYGSGLMQEIMTRYTRALSRHTQDEILSDENGE